MGFLTDDIIQNLEIKEKYYKVWHERGLYLHVSPKGGKYWRFKYKFDNKEKQLAIGTYPIISINAAMEILLEAKANLARGIDPSLVKKLSRKISAKKAKPKLKVTYKYLIKISSQLTKINRNILKLLEAIEKK